MNKTACLTIPFTEWTGLVANRTHRRTALSRSLGSCFGTREVTSLTARQDRLLDDSAHNQLQALPDRHEAVLSKYVEWPRSLGDTRVPMNAISRVGWGGRATLTLYRIHL